MAFESVLTQKVRTKNSHAKASLKKKKNSHATKKFINQYIRLSVDFLIDILQV